MDVILNFIAGTVHLVQYLIKQLSGADLIILSGIAASALQGLLKRYKDFSKHVNWLIATIFPFVTTLSSVLIAGHDALKSYPWVFFAAQASYQVVNFIRTNAKQADAPEVEALPESTVQQF